MNPKLHARFESLKSSGLLPSPKGPALAVVHLTRQDNISSAELARAIQPDPALVARLLKLANACRTAGARPILSLKDAIGILGMTSVRGLALGFSLMNNSQGERCRAFDYPHFWSKNLARAVAMQSLAAVSRIIQSDEAFTLGLLSRVGELGLASLFPEDYAQLLVSAKGAASERLAQERQAFDFDHAELTVALLADWGFPASLTEPVGFQEQAEAAVFAPGSRTERLLLTLMLASKIANVCLAAKEQRRAKMAELFLLGGKLSIGADALMVLCDRIVSDWTDWCHLLEVPAQSMPPFAELMNAPPAPSIEHSEGVSKVSAAEGFRVLVVDDDRSIRLLLVSLLTRAGYLCSEAENGRQGLERARTESPDLMVVDWMMPEMDGIELIRRLRETERGRAIYILLLTGLDEEARLVEAFAAGADDFMAKPLKAAVLIARLLAGQRVITLQREMARDHSNLQRFATEFATLNVRLQAGYHDNLASQKRMELALHGGDLGMWDWHIQSHAMVFNERWCSMLGYQPDEIKPHIDSWLDLINPDDRELVNTALLPHLKGEKTAYECEHRMRHKDGHWVWILDRGKVVERDATGEALRVVGTHMDITARKHIEVELLRSNTELEQFSYSISHDMRQPLRMISSYLQLLQKGLGDALDLEQREYFNFAIDGAQRLDSMLRGLLDYSRIGRQGDPFVWVESRPLLDQALLFLRPAIAEARAKVSVEGEWPRIFACPDQLLRLLQNLIGNAIKFRVDGRLPRLQVSATVSENVWHVSISDNGIGILPDQIGRLFQVFQRLQSRAAFEGTGIGLALCRKIVEHHGGQISVASAGIDRGSTFAFSLPVGFDDALHQEKGHD